MTQICPRAGGTVAANPDGTCGSCGSLTPTQVFAALTAGAKIKPLSKNFKMELEGANAPQTTGPCVFMFQHFSLDQRAKFEKMLIDGQLTFVDPPGQFFRLPFFVAAQPPAQPA